MIYHNPKFPDKFLLWSHHLNILPKDDNPILCYTLTVSKLTSGHDKTSEKKRR